MKRSWIVQSQAPLLTKEQCEDIITKMKDNAKQNEGAKINTGEIVGPVSRQCKLNWLPYKENESTYQTINSMVDQVNLEHFCFDKLDSNELAQYTEYETNGYYDWHFDTNVHTIGDKIRKISMTLLLNDPSEFEGGELELLDERGKSKLKQGHVIFFASFIRHRVTEITKGNRKALIMWFHGVPFK